VFACALPTPDDPHESIPGTVRGRPAAAIRRWIDEGAKTPAAEAVVSSAKSKHWSFQPVVRHPEPLVKDARWPRNGIDRFILARLEKEGIAPSPEADPITLLRRLQQAYRPLRRQRSFAQQVRQAPTRTASPPGRRPRY
jgi:hypothetical protein